jgi:Ni/Fe-hydrogenase subunit HybB-like protein
MSATPLRRSLITPTMLVLAAVAAIGLYFIAQRFLHGLGAVTNLNPGYPWGIWVVFDIVIGTAFGCGGFAIALLVYIFNRGEYHPLVRPALLGGLFGYTLAGAAVLIDIGRYWNAYNLLLPWHAQPNSVMLEVALCVMAYVAVLWIEFSPAVLERLGLTGVKRVLERWMFLIIALGVLLPTMHQSSLGSLLLVMGPKLSPLWHTAWLPVLFVVSALAMGYAIVMFEATVVSSSFNLPSEHALIGRMSKVVGWLMLAWLVLRFVDLIVGGALRPAFAFDLMAVFFWIENLLIAFAVAVFLTPAGRASRRLSFLAAVALLLGGSLYRLDAFLIGYRPVGNWTYFPSVPEIMVTVGIVALEILLYLVFIKTLPVLHGGGRAHAQRA